MAKLIAKSAFAGLLPQEANGLHLSEVATGPVTSIAPFRGQDKVVSDALKAQFGIGLPRPNRSNAKDGVRLLWAGKGRTLLIGGAPTGLDDIAALTDQTGANAVMLAKGAGIEEVLARLVPMDLRRSQFKQGHTARTMLGHMNVSITRVGADAFEIMAMRSMAGTLLHDVTQASAAVAARAAL